MPTYAYACTDCDHRFEVVQSFSDDSLTVCPECEGRLRKVFNAVGIVFKGGGFYRTDSRSGGSSSVPGTSSESSGSTKSSGADSSNTKSSSGSGSSDSSGGSSSSSGSSTASAPATASSTAAS